MSSVQSIVFDLDGTLVDSSPDIAAALNKAFAPRGVRGLSAAEVLAMLGGGPRVLVAKALDAVGSPAEGAELDELVEVYSQHYRANPVDGTTCFADAARAIPALHARGVLLGICTNKRTDIAHQTLAGLGLAEYFGAVIGSDLASHTKPDAAHLIETLESLGADPARCVYVGDTEIDAATAEAAGVEYRHVAWGHMLERKRQSIEQFSDLEALIG